MKSLKKILLTVLLSTTVLSGVVVSNTAFAYSANVEKKLEKIQKEIDQQNEKISKQNEKRSNRNNSSSSSSTKTEKIRDKISDLQEDAADIRKKEDAKIAKVVKGIESRKKQSSNNIARLEKDKIERTTAAKTKYENDVKSRKVTDPTYVAQPFTFNTASVDRQIAAEKEKLVKLDQDIAKARGVYTKKNN